MASAKIFRINYKSDFILTLTSDAGWMTPFCIKFWTGAPSQAYYVGWDGETYNHCSFDPSEPTKLQVQFDDHHLPIGDLKYQVAYHFTVADFPNDTEDEVINPANITTEIDGETYHVMLDFTGETAPEIQFSLPAYANEAQRIENEQQRIANEQQRIDNEQQRIENEQTRQRNEGTRIENEQERVQEFGQMKGELEQATRDAAAAAENANEKGVYAKNQGDYAKQQGDYAKQQGDIAKADHERAEDDHRIAGDDHIQAGSDHTRAGEDHTQAGSDHTRAGEDHTRAGEDHTRAGEDHTRAESDHAAVEVYVDSLGAFDISAYHATGGVLAKYANLTAALGTNGANIPQALRKGGMSVKFVQTSDNKYVQFRFMSSSTANADFTNIANWQGIDKSPKQGSKNILESGGVADTLGFVTYNDDWVKATTDKDGRVIEGINSNFEKHIEKFDDSTVNVLNAEIIDKNKSAGKVLINKELADSVSLIPNEDWSEAKTNNSGQVIEGITAKGEKYISGDLLLSDVRIAYLDNEEWVKATTDKEGKVIEGINSQLEKHISGFDKATQKTISSECLDVYKIPVLNEAFSTSIPFKVYNGSTESTAVKGKDNAKYIFNLPLKDSWNIRFKFRITENILNAARSNVEIASINSAKVIANAIPLTQYVTEQEYNGETKNVYWGTTNGGVCFNSNTINRIYNRRNLGVQAFSVRYIGDGTDVTVANDGTAIVFNIDGVATTYSFTTYSKVEELYAAISANPDFEVAYAAIDTRLTSELAKFTAVKMKSYYYCSDDGSYEPTRRELLDNPPVYIYYAVDDSWHQVEIVKSGDIIYSSCDGVVVKYTEITEDNELVLGGDCRVLFKDLEIHTNSLADAEIHYHFQQMGDFLISSVNPYIAIFEGHDVVDNPAYIAKQTPVNYGMNPDTLDLIFSSMKEKGYLPVSIEQVADFLNGGAPLPKRCYVMIFDDERWNICLNNNTRAVFNRYASKPCLAIITQGNRPITHNGVTITKEQAVSICKDNNFSLVSHTRTHRSTYGIKPSQYIEYLRGDVYDCDLKGINGSVIVYPGGNANPYMYDTLEYLGFKVGIEIMGGILKNNIIRNKYFLSRIDISRVINANGTPKDYREFLYRMY